MLFRSNLFPTEPSSTPDFGRKIKKHRTESAKKPDNTPITMRNIVLPLFFGLVVGGRELFGGMIGILSEFGPARLTSLLNLKISTAFKIASEYLVLQAGAG